MCSTNLKNVNDTNEVDLICLSRGSNTSIVGLEDGHAIVPTPLTNLRERFRNGSSCRGQGTGGILCQDDTGSPATRGSTSTIMNTNLVTKCSE